MKLPLTTVNFREPRVHGFSELLQGSRGAHDVRHAGLFRPFHATTPQQTIVRSIFPELSLITPVRSTAVPASWNPYFVDAPQHPQGAIIRAPGKDVQRHPI